MDDCISRQQAIDALKNDMASLDHIIKGMSANDVRLDAYVSQRNQVNYDICTINSLPHAQPDTNCSEIPNNWIPCSERLPKDSGRYLVSVLDGIDRRTTVAPYHPLRRTWTLTGRMAYWKVIAWLPLPEPYQEGGEADE